MSLPTSTISLLCHMFAGTRANRLLILIYHRVHPKPDPMFPGEVDAECFDWQMALLRQYCNPLSLSKGVSGLKRGMLPPRAVAITFDDGYADNAIVALPALQKHGLTATFFIATSFLDGGRMWNDSIIEAVRHSSASTLDTDEIGLGAIELGSVSQRGPVAERIIKAVKHRPADDRQRLVNALCERARVSLPDDLMMSAGQVRQLAEAGMEIGAHTQSHPILRTLDTETAAAEIEGSRRVLEQIIGRSVSVFAYPNGRPGDDYTERDRQIVEGLGFYCAPSTRWGVATPDSDLYQLPRFTPWDRTPARWLMRLLSTYSRPG